MIRRAEERGTIKPGDTLIEATSGNTGIALAMAAAMRGYRMVLVMPEHLSIERRQTMRAFGAEIVLTSKDGGMEFARDLAETMQREGAGVILDQFANPDNPLAHYETTGPELWRETNGTLTHFVSSMGTTGTIMGVSRYLKEQNPAIRIVGAQPDEGSQIPGIRKWPEAYLPKIFDASRVDQVENVSQADAEAMARRLAAEEGIFAGISAAGALCIALRVAETVQDATIVVHRLRPRRPLPVDRRLPGLTSADRRRPPCGRHVVSSTRSCDAAAFAVWLLLQCLGPDREDHGTTTSRGSRSWSASSAITRICTRPSRRVIERRSARARCCTRSCSRRTSRWSTKASIRHRVNKSNSFRVNGEYIQIAYRISIRASDGKWQRIDVGKESIKREFENFVRRMLIVEHLDKIRAYVDALRAPHEDSEYSVPDLTSIWGPR